MTPLPSDEPIKGDTVDIVNANERWNEYLLEDGNLLRVKLIVIRVVKTEGDIVKQEGIPNYKVKTQLVMDAVKAPEGGE